MPYTQIEISSHKTDLHEALRVAVGHLAVDPKEALINSEPVKY
jgi:hypothetical protein